MSQCYSFGAHEFNRILIHFACRNAILLEPIDPIEFTFFYKSQYYSITSLKSNRILSFFACRNTILLGPIDSIGKTKICMSQNSIGYCMYVRHYHSVIYVCTFLFFCDICICTSLLFCDICIEKVT